jgi:hypothetical protein
VFSSAVDEILLAAVQRQVLDIERVRLAADKAREKLS